MNKVAQLKLEKKQALDGLRWERQKTLRLEALLRAREGELKQLLAQVPGRMK